MWSVKSSGKSLLFILFIVNIPLNFLIGIHSAAPQSVASTYAPPSTIQSSSLPYRPSYGPTLYGGTSAVPGQAFRNYLLGHPSSNPTHGQAFGTLPAYGQLFGTLPHSQLCGIRPLSQAIHPAQNLSSNLTPGACYYSNFGSNVVNSPATNNLQQQWSPYPSYPYPSMPNISAPLSRLGPVSGQNFSAAGPVTMSHHLTPLPRLSQSTLAPATFQSFNRWTTSTMNPADTVTLPSYGQEPIPSSQQMLNPQTSMHHYVPTDVSMWPGNTQQTPTTLAGEYAGYVWIL